MADPTKYIPGYSYTGFQTVNPEKPLPAPQVDNDFANIRRSIDETIDAVRDVRREDGALRNESVTFDSLHPDVAAALGLGEGGPIAGLTVSAFAGSAIVVSSEGIGTVHNDTSIPTSEAVRLFVQEAGVSLPTGGSPGQVPVKLSNDDFDIGWADIETGGGSETVGMDVYSFTGNGGATYTLPAEPLLPKFCFISMNGVLLNHDGFSTSGTTLTFTENIPTGQKFDVIIFRAALVEGTDGEDAFVYVAFASGEDGSNFSLTPDPSLGYIAVLSTNAEIAVPDADDFDGLWVRFKGFDGNAATIEVGDVFTGDPGTDVEVENVGTPSAAVFDFTIPRGADGDDGDDATITIGVVTTGDPGTAAEVENVGTPSAAVLDFVIPRGDDGEAATITIGTVTTGDPGTDAEVDNVGTSNAAILNITIPRGSDGAGAVSTVNGVSPSSGNVTIDADDIDDASTTHKFATAAQLALADAAVQPGDSVEDLIEGSTKKLLTTAERAKLGHLTVTQAVDLDAIETRVNSLDTSVVLRGTWDASGGTFPGGGTAQSGDSYIVSVGGTVDGVAFDVGDRALAILDNASTTTFAANWFKEDYTDRVSSVAGRTGTITLAIADLTDAGILAALAALTGSNDDFIQKKSGAFTTRSVAQVKTDLGVNNVDNTSNSTERAATATLTNKTLTTPTITLKQGSAPTPTSEGDIQWDTDDNVLVIGDGAGQQIFLPAPASVAAGDLFYASGAKVLTRLPKGTAGQVLAMNSGATAPEWVSGGGGGGRVLLGTLNMTSGTSQSLTGIASGYRDIYFEIDGVTHDNGGSRSVTLALSGTGGSAYGTAVSVTGTVNSAGVHNGSGYITNVASAVAAAKGIDALAFIAGVVTSIRAAIATDSAADVDAIRVALSSTGNFTAGVVRFYGVP